STQTHNNGTIAARVMLFLSKSSLRLTLVARTLSSSSRCSSLDFPRAPTAAELVERAPQSAQKYLRLMRAHKPTGTLLLYWPGAWAIAAAAPAGSAPSVGLLALFGGGAFAMRSAGCIINDLWDRDLDREVERTRNRPLASGEVSAPQAVGLLAGLLSCSLAILCTLSTPSIIVGASSMVLVVGYPLAKRYTNWPQIVLGATFNWSVLIAWTHLMPPDQWWKVLPLYFATCLHTFIYDTIYAHQDKKDDARMGMHSTALHLGDRTRRVLGGCTVGMLGSLSLAGVATDQTWPYFVAVLGTCAHVGWQVASVRTEDPADCWSKFVSNTWLGAVLLAGIIAGNLMKKKKKE
ncbi:hypothetical protein PENTCL1PPCAC_30156, partial [Pristionchus entomophagus]